MFVQALHKLRFTIGARLLKTYVVRSARGGRRLHHRRSRADRGVIRQIFVKRDYAIDRLRRAEDLLQTYGEILSQGKTPLVIDAGANIGASVVWFADQFPLSHIVAIEPDADNFRLLQVNAEGLNVDLYEAAIGSTDGAVMMIDPGEGQWGYQTKEAINGPCQRLSLSRLIHEKQKQGYVPFLIKIDIEGGEDNLFETMTEWVDLFPLLIIELHDWLLPKQGTSLNFLRRIARSNRDFVHIGENVFSIRN